MLSNIIDPRVGFDFCSPDMNILEQCWSHGSLKGTRQWPFQSWQFPVNEDQGLGPRATTVKNMPRKAGALDSLEDFFRKLGDWYKLIDGAVK